MATLSEKLRPAWRFVLGSTYRREVMAVLSESVGIVSVLCGRTTVRKQRSLTNGR